MNVAYYTMAIDNSIDHFLEEILGIGETHAKRNDQGPFVVQANFSYLNEMIYKQKFFVQCSLINFDKKKMHLFLEIISSSNNEVMAFSEQFETFEILRTYGEDYKCIFVGDASMSPYEIMIPGGGNEHYNEEAGHVWLERVTNKWSSHLWINPTPQKYWSYSHTTQIIKQIFDNKMVPLTIEGLVEGTKILSRKY